jgi:hypothetical protein
MYLLVFLMAPTLGCEDAAMGTKRQSRNTLMSQVKHRGRNLSMSQQVLRQVVVRGFVQRRRRGPKTTVIKL